MSPTSSAFLVSGFRSPVGRYAGALSSIRPDDLAALAIKNVIEDTGIDPALIDDVILGNANGAGEDNRNVARMAWLLAGYSDTVPGVTVNRLCASGMTAISTAAALVNSGQADLVIAGGVESMSRAPWVMEKPKNAFSKPGEVFDTSIGWRFVNPVFKAQEKTTFSMPETAEEVAKVYSISREAADQFALDSQQKANQAIQAGKFEREMFPVPVTDRKGEISHITADEGPRPGTTMEALDRLRPVVGGGTVVTAGNSSALNDGSSAVLVASERAIEKYGLRARARIVGNAVAGLAPEIMGIGPVPATDKLMKRTGWSIDSVDAWELNEAFASQSLACIDKLHLDTDKVNAWGGAIALGHPLGSSGARITLTLLNRLETDGGSKGVATMCIGVGQGQALAIEKV